MLFLLRARRSKSTEMFKIDFCFLHSKICFIFHHFSLHVCKYNRLLGQKDLSFLSNSFTVFFFVVPYILLRLKSAALRGVQDIGLSTVWGVFAVYQSVRCILWLLRLRHLAKRADREQQIST